MDFKETQDTITEVMGASFSKAFLYKGYYQKEEISSFADDLQKGLPDVISFAVVFASRDYMENLGEFISILQEKTGCKMIFGCSGAGIVGNETEMENSPGFVFHAFSLPSVRVKPVIIDPQILQKNLSKEEWVNFTGVAADEVKLWISLIDPFNFVVEDWMDQWNEVYPGVPFCGGLASSYSNMPESWVFLNDQIVKGGLGVALDGDFGVHSFVSQGTIALGGVHQIQHVENNVIYRLDDQTAFEAYNSIFKQKYDEEKQIAPGYSQRVHPADGVLKVEQVLAGLGLVFGSKEGPYLVRNIFGGDKESGTISLSAVPEKNQFFQFRLRNAQTSSEELKSLLEEARESLKDKKVIGSIIGSCTGRGERFFCCSHHDAELFSKYFPQIPLSGFFSQGEIGTLHGKSYSHEQSISAVVFYES